MHLEITNGWSLLLAAGGVAFFVGIYLLIARVCDRSDPRTKAAIKALEREDARVAALPKLDTRRLIKVPSKYLETLGNHGRGVRNRTFNIRRSYVFVYDYNGDGWMGLVTRSTLESLRAGEYVLREHFIPLCGRGEKTAGISVHLEGFLIDVYPTFMDVDGDIHEWQVWIQLKKEFLENEQRTKKSARELFQEVLPPQMLQQFNARRKHYDGLRASIQARAIIQTRA